MALANDPSLLIADEPTTALDVTTQAQILDLLRSLQVRLNMAILLISHDLGVVRHMAGRIYVMRRGGIVESGPREKIFSAPEHPYTRELLRPRSGRRPVPVAGEAPVLVSVRNLNVSFSVGRTFLGRPAGHVRAVRDVSLDIRQGESLGVVGESGSGKTTLGLALLRLVRSRGDVFFRPHRLSAMKERRIRPLRRDFQIVFQDPYGSLSPRMTVGRIVAEGLDAHRLAAGQERKKRIAGILKTVKLNSIALSAQRGDFFSSNFQLTSSLTPNDPAVGFARTKVITAFASSIRASFARTPTSAFSEIAASFKEAAATSPITRTAISTSTSVKPLT